MVKKVLVVLLCVLCLMGQNAWGAENDWKERLQKAEKGFAQIKVEHGIMYRMVSELYIKRFGYQKYHDLIMAEKYGKEKQIEK